MKVSVMTTASTSPERAEAAPLHRSWAHAEPPLARSWAVTLAADGGGAALMWLVGAARSWDAVNPAW